MTQDEQNLNLLSVFHYVVAGLTALFSCIFIVHIAMGVAMLSGVFDSKDAPPRIFAWLFIVIPAFAMLCGWTLSVLIIMAGRRLKRRVSRTFCIVVAALECINMPFGTILGIFTLIVLSKDQVKLLFDANECGRTVDPGSPFRP